MNRNNIHAAIEVTSKGEKEFVDDIMTVKSSRYFIADVSTADPGYNLVKRQFFLTDVP